MEKTERRIEAGQGTGKLASLTHLKTRPVTQGTVSIARQKVGRENQTGEKGEKARIVSRLIESRGRKARSSVTGIT